MSLQFLSDKESHPSHSHTSPVISVCWIPSASSSQGVILSGDCEGYVKAFDAQSALCYHALPKVHKNAVHCVTTNTAGDVALSNAVDGSIAIWDLKTFRGVRDAAGEEEGGSEVAGQEPALLTLPVDDPATLLAGTIDSITTTSTQTKLSEAWKTALHPTAPLFASVGAGVTVSLHSTTTFGELLSVATLPSSLEKQKDLFGLALAFHPSGNLLAVGTNSGQVLLYALSSIDLTLASTYLDHPSPIRALSFTPDLLLVGSDDRTISVHDIKPIMQPQQSALTGERIGGTVASLTGHKGWVTGVAPTSEASVFASVGADKSIKFWDLNSPTKGTPVWNGGETQAIGAFCFQPRAVEADDERGDTAQAATATAAGSSSMTRFVTASHDGKLRWYRGAGLG